ncbi:MAG TPA: 1-(5-phosphoribosyl)-5-[(5-phosphoribosylamino)methylideneamino] imidazole-4-carboxamide isomerase [Clostridia bacterium]|nr:1-(5-phosphoribosyl)-5-[(5-phosphoribosylamino)methylideneamino] imidazole-4-carboxamide isomerase [Clostridia bacterium]
MLVIPSIDIMQGKTVRLIGGKPEGVVEYAEDPVSAAVRWEREGAPYLHVVDLDGAFRGRPVNHAVYGEIARAVRVPIEVGGGLRSVSDIEKALDLGCWRAVISTAAFSKEGFLKEVRGRFGDRVVVSVDAGGIEGKVKVSGWRATGRMNVEEAVRELKALGFSEFIFQDVFTDGTLGGPRFKLIENVCALGLSVIIAGGVSCLEDIAALKTLADSVRGIRHLKIKNQRDESILSFPPKGTDEVLGESASEEGAIKRRSRADTLTPGRPGGSLKGVIVGRALYDGRIRLRDALMLGG